MQYKYTVTSVEQTQQIAKNLACKLQKGDLIMLTGGLGAGKTTFTKGLAQSLNVKGQVSSPTFIVARVHPSLSEGPNLIHVDAYRIDTLEDLETLDLDSSIDEAVTVVEWGQGKVENLSACRLEINIDRKVGQISDSLSKSKTDDVDERNSEIFCADFVDKQANIADSVRKNLDSDVLDENVVACSRDHDFVEQTKDCNTSEQAKNPSFVLPDIVDLSELDDGQRQITIKAIGSRWEKISLSSLL